MLVHSVYFWLKPELTAEQVAEFEQGLSSLLTIASVKDGYYGRPSSTNRPVIDRSYSFGLTVIFNMMADHDAYQINPVHAAFSEKNASKWDRVLIYDTETAHA